MNTTRNPNSSSPHKNFRVLDLALQAAETTIALVDRVPAKLRSLGDQVRAMLWRLLHPKS